jgi:hypothetical protein
MALSPARTKKRLPERQARTSGVTHPLPLSRGTTSSGLTPRHQRVVANTELATAADDDRKPRPAASRGPAARSKRASLVCVAHLPQEDPAHVRAIAPASARSGRRASGQLQISLSIVKRQRRSEPRASCEECRMTMVRRKPNSPANQPTCGQAWPPGAAGPQTVLGYSEAPVSWAGRKTAHFAGASRSG